jgi:hypothetical protein
VPCLLAYNRTNRAEGAGLDERVADPREPRVPAGADHLPGPHDGVVVEPVFVVTQAFPARPSSIPDIREFVLRYLAESPLTPEGHQQVHHAVLTALLDAASPDGQIQVCFRIFPDGVEVDVLRGPAAAGGDFPQVRRDRPEHRSFAEWLSGVLKREGLSQEAAARQLGVSVKTVSRWVGGETEPRLRELRRIHEVFGEAPIG